MQQLGRFLLCLVLLGSLGFGLDFSVRIDANGVPGTLHHVVDNGQVLERIFLNDTLEETYLRRFLIPGLDGVYSSQLVITGEWSPPISMCCRHTPLENSEINDPVAVNLGDTFDLKRQNETVTLTVVEILSGTPVRSEIEAGFEQAELACPLFCSQQMDLVEVLDISGSIGTSELIQYQLFIERSLQRFDISDDRVVAGLASFSGNTITTAPDTFCIPINNTVGDAATWWSDARTDVTWVEDVNWIEPSSVAADYQCWSIVTDPSQGSYNTNTGGYASVECPISGDANQVRTIGGDLTNDRAFEGFSHTSIGTGIRMTMQMFDRNVYDRNTPKVMIVMTDGENNRGEAIDPNFLIQDLNATGIQRYVLGVGLEVNDATLELIAGSPDRVFRVDSFDQITDVLDILVASSCQMTGTMSMTDSCQAPIPTLNNQPPECDITVDPGDSITPVETLCWVNATDNDGFIKSITVDWNDGTSELCMQNPCSHTYTSNGTYTIVVTVCDNDDVCIAKNETIVLIPNTPPVCDLTVTPGGGDLGVNVTAIVTVTDTTGNITSVIVNWGNNVTSDCASECSYQYPEPGVYNVTLTACDNKGTCTTTTETVVINSPPTVDCEVTPTTGTVPETVILTIVANDTDGTIVTTTVEWGDGTTSECSGSCPHTYTSVGNFTVTVTVTDDFGSNATTTTSVQIVPNLPPSCTVHWSTNSSVVPTQVTVVYNCTDNDGNVTQVEIDYGDGTNSGPLGSSGTEEWDYNNPGNYTAVLTVTDDKNTTVSIPIGPIVCTSNDPPVIDLEVTPTSGTAPLNVTITGTVTDTTGSISTVVLECLSQNFTFGGDFVLNFTFPTHGSYPVRLIAVDSYGSTTTVTTTVVVNGPPNVNFQVNPSNGVAPLDVIADVNPNDPEGNIATVVIHWGDGTSTNVCPGGCFNQVYQRPHQYSGNGTFDAEVCVTDQLGAETCVSQLVEVIFNHPPTATLDIVPTSGESPLAGTISVNADDVDGTVSQILITVNGTDYTFPGPNVVLNFNLTVGVYPVTVVVTDDGGKEIVLTETIVVENGPVCQISATPTSGVAPETVELTIAASGSTPLVDVTIEWGDGQTDTIPVSGLNLTLVRDHQFTNGTFNIEVTVRDDQNRTETQTVTVGFTVNQPPVLILLPDGSSGTEPFDLVIDVNATDPDGEILQVECNGVPVTNGSFSITLPAGTYPVTCVATDDKGGQTNETLVVFVNAPPVLNISATTDGTVPLNVNLTVSAVDSDGTIDQVVINWGDGVIENFPNDGVFQHVYNTSGQHQISVTCFDDFGDSVVQTVTVVADPAPVLTSTVTPSSGDGPLLVSLAANATDAFGTIGEIIVDWGDSTIGNCPTTCSTSHTYAPGNYTVVVSVEDDAGNRVEQTHIVFVNSPPTVGLSVTPSTGVAPEDITIQVNPTDSDGTIVSTVLFFGDGTAVNDTSAVKIYPAGNFTVMACATDDFGSTVCGTVDIQIAPNVGPMVLLTASPVVGYVPQEVTCSGSATDTDGEIVSTELDFGDGTVFTNVSFNQAHTYNSTGNFTITATACDDKGLCDTHTIPVSIRINSPPTAAFQTVPVAGVVPFTLALDASDSSDPDGQSLTYDWSWSGDSFTGMQPSLSITQTGRYSIELTVTDPLGLSDSTSRVVYAVAGTGGPENPGDDDDTLECKDVNGTLVCSPVRLGAFCVNRFLNLAAFEYLNADNRTISIAPGPNNFVSDGSAPPTTVFQPLGREWFWLNWTGGVLEWTVTDPATNLTAIGHIDDQTRPCTGSENPGGANGAGGLGTCSSASTLTSIF